MLPPIPFAPRRRAVGVALVLAQVTACMTWRPVPGALDQQVGATHISHARVRLRDGSELPLRDVTVGADSVIGYDESSRERRACPLADVGSIDRLQVSAGRTAIVVGSSLAVIAAFTGAVIGSVMGSTAGTLFGR